MGAGKKIAAGAVLGGGGFLLRVIGNTILGATGASQGPYLDYAFLVNGAGWLLMALGGLVAGIGVLTGLYHLLSGGEERPRRRGRRSGRPAEEDAEPRQQRRHPRQGGRRRKRQRRQENDRTRSR